MSPYFLNKSINVRRAELPYTLCAARVKPLLLFSQSTSQSARLRERQVEKREPVTVTTIRFYTTALVSAWSVSLSRGLASSTYVSAYSGQVVRQCQRDCSEFLIISNTV